MALVMEYCDAGCLSDAIVDGLFLRQLQPTTSSHGEQARTAELARMCGDVFCTGHARRMAQHGTRYTTAVVSLMPHVCFALTACVLHRPERQTQAHAGDQFQGEP